VPLQSANKHLTKKKIDEVEIKSLPNGEFCVRGLMPGQTLMKTSDGKLVFLNPPKEGK
jgi:hypothetical protein